MPQNILFCLTEGDHDSAFIYRILKAHKYTTFNNIIKDFPQPLNAFLQSDILNVTIPEVKVQQAKSRFLPAYVMEKNTNLILIYSIGGDTKDSIRISLIKALNALNVSDSDAIQAFPETNLSVLYFFDADNIGTEARMSQMLNECKECFHEAEFKESYAPSIYHVFDDMKIAAHVFAKQNEDKGMLEDILIPMMNEGNDDIFDRAKSFLSIHSSAELFKGGLTYDESQTILKKVNGQKYSHSKSLIGTIGQLQKSGKSNTVCISDSDYLTDNKIINNNTCSKIAELIESAFE